MDRDQIRSELRSILNSVSQKLASRTDIGDDTPLREGLGLDSLQTLEMHFEIESRLGITIQESEAMSLRTFGDLAALIAARQGKDVPRSDT